MTPQVPSGTPSHAQVHAHGVGGTHSGSGRPLPGWGGGHAERLRPWGQRGCPSAEPLPVGKRRER